MNNNALQAGEARANDEVLLITRLVALVVIPFVVLAFLVLYFTPDQSAQRFAWAITPHMMAAFIAAGYMGGAYFFLRVLLARRWHQVSAGFLPVTAFTWFMLASTIVHWSRFDIHHFPFQLWLILYLVTPLLVPLIYMGNSDADPHTPDAGDIEVPQVIRRPLMAGGAVIMACCVIGFIVPDLVVSIWPWKLTLLTARVLCGWWALLGVGGLRMATESRWSGWRISMESIGLWHLLVVVAAVANPGDFAGRLNWYIPAVVVLLIVMATTYIVMERQRRQATPVGV
jgi:hypothetical protein